MNVRVNEGDPVLSKNLRHFPMPDHYGIEMVIVA